MKFKLFMLVSALLLTFNSAEAFFFGGFPGFGIGVGTGYGWGGRRYYGDGYYGGWGYNRPYRYSNWYW